MGLKGRRAAAPARGGVGLFDGQLLATWRLHSRISIEFLAAIPAAGLRIAPAGPRARTLGQVFAHQHNVRFAWLRHFAPAAVRDVTPFTKGAEPTAAQLRAAFTASGQAVERFLARVLTGEAKIKSFRRSPVRWMSYLISHESHHRGQIAAALRQHGHKLPTEVSIRLLWQDWYWGKE
ncbi:MAG: DinB family protein [Gemmatimonadota bacterium]|nr:DinB family protein [Gemmatimonadota bacterium]